MTNLGKRIFLLCKIVVNSWKLEKSLVLGAGAATAVASPGQGLANYPGSLPQRGRGLKIRPGQRPRRGLGLQR